MGRQIKKTAVMIFAGIGILMSNVHCAKEQEAVVQTGIFCWDEEAADAPEKMDELTEKLKITRWYQEFPEKIDVETASKFIGYMSEKGILVDALVGSVDWGFEEDGASLTACIEEISAYNAQVSSAGRINGVMVDVEPYITEKFKENKEKYMGIYVQGMKKAYTYAKKKGICFIACIPRHYDDQGLTDQLEELISEACDEVAVMNYGRGNEVQMIDTEALFAEKYEKPLHCILEFQEVGKHGLTENETYREAGIKDALAVWEEIRESYPKVQMTADYHWTRPLLEMLKGE